MDAIPQAVFDIFIWAHFLGALCKMLILRDWKITWALLVVWEVIEYSFQHAFGARGGDSAGKDADAGSAPRLVGQAGYIY